jgi:hypothetical protein
MVGQLSRPDTRAEFAAKHPGYAAAFTNDTEYNRCLVNSANRLRATRDDYLARAQMVCSFRAR